MTTRQRIQCAIVLVLLFFGLSSLPGYAQRDSIPDGYPQSLQNDRDSLTEALVKDPKNPSLWKRLAAVYMNMGDDLLDQEEDKIAIYEKGVTAAEQALALRETDAEAHFLYAANLGNAAKLQGLAVGAVRLGDIIKHVDRAIELDGNHAPSLQLKGGLLAELPWYLGGNEELAQDYLRKAIAIDGNFTNARIMLAKLLLKNGHPDRARSQLLRVVQASQPHYPYTWTRKFRPEAQKLLNKIKNH